MKPGITEVRFELGNGSVPLTITGEDRTDVLCELQVWSNGFDETEARKYASETALKFIETGASLALSIKYPEPGSQRATLVVRMPKTLTARVQPSRGKLDISDIAVVELVEARGQAAVRRVAGRLTATHRGGALTIEDVAALKLNTRGSTVVLKGVTGDALMQVQAGELRGQAFGGAIEIESNGTRLTLEDLAGARPPMRISAVGGSVKVIGLRSEARIDGRDTRIDVTIAQPASVAIYNEQEEPMDVTLPAGGFHLDALAIDGRLTVPPGLPEVKTTDNEQRATGAVGGGGPTVTLRSSRGNITIRGKG